MGETTKRFETAYRPRKFSEVLGQKPIVDELSALIRRGKIGRNLLLAGDRGSGKTSVVRLYAKALSCENNDADGSPCGNCRMCLAEPGDRGRFKRDDSGLFEYDTAAAGGGKGEIERFMAAVRATDIPAKTRVVFFDEAHALENPDALLKDVGEGTDDIIYCFATTAPRKLGAPLLSRLWQYTVRALPDDVAIGLLRRVAEQEKLSFDLEAIKLLAAVKRNYPRDLLIGLGQMASTGNHITADAVKAAFGVNQIDSLAAYFTALANGDKKLQTRAFRDWNETKLVKAQWISTFLISLYYNHVLGVTRVIDPLIHASIESHAAILENWARRLGLQNDTSLRRYWQRLLAFWSLHRPHDESSASLAIALFEWAADERGPGDLSASAALGGIRLDQDRDPRLTEPSERASDPPPGIDAVAVPFSEFTTRGDVQLIINRASYFAQHYGVYFDVFIEIAPHSEQENDAVAEINAFCAAFSQHFDAAIGGGKPPFAAIAFIERSQEKGVYGLMTAYLGVDDHASGVAALGAYLGPDPDSSVRSDVLQHKSKALSFHWDSVFDLCASYDESYSDEFAGFRTGLLERLGVRRRRGPRPIRHKRTSFFGAIADQEIESAQAYKMTFLSAFDDGAFDWVRKGWERDEAPTRQRQVDERKRQIAQVKEQFGNDPRFLQQELDKLYATWPENSKRRRRKWTGWWE